MQTFNSKTNHCKKGERTEDRIGKTAEKVHKQYKLTKRHLKKYDTAKAKKLPRKKLCKRKCVHNR